MHVNEYIRNVSKTCRKIKGGIDHVPKELICKISNSNVHEY